MKKWIVLGAVIALLTASLGVYAAPGKGKAVGKSFSDVGSVQTLGAMRPKGIW